MHKTCIFTPQHPAGGQHDLWRLCTADISTRPAGPSCSCLRVERALRGHPYHAAALGAGRPGPGKDTCCLNTPWFSNCPPWYGNTLQSPAFSKLGFLHWHPLPTFSLSRGSLLGLEVCPNLFILSAPETGSFVFTLHHRQCSPWCIYFKASLLRGLPAGKRFYLTQRYHKLIYLYLLKLWSRSIRKNAWKHSKECWKKLSATFSLQSPGYKVEGAFACLHICKRLCTPFTDFFFYYWSHEGLLATLST